MPKPEMKEPYATLAREVIATLLAGHRRWRPDLDYPESHSDMLGAVMGLFEMFEVERRDLPFRVPLVGDELRALWADGYASVKVDFGDTSGHRYEARDVRVDSESDPEAIIIRVPRKGFRT